MEHLTYGARPHADRAFKILQPLDVGFGFGPEMVAAAMQKSRVFPVPVNRPFMAKQPQGLVASRDLSKGTGAQTAKDLQGNLRWDTPTMRTKNSKSENSKVRSPVTAEGSRGQSFQSAFPAATEAPAVDFGQEAPFALTRTTADISRELLGEVPSRWSVLLAVCVDASLCFALLAASQMAVLIGGWQEFLARILVDPGVPGWLQKISTLLGGPLAPYGLKAPSSEALVQLGLVLGGWVVLLWAVQLFCVAAWGGTLGRTLAGIRLNPIASRSSGRLGVPIFEVLTFGGLFTLPIALVRPDKHVFLSNLRYRS